MTIKVQGVCTKVGGCLATPPDLSRQASIARVGLGERAARPGTASRLPVCLPIHLQKVFRLPDCLPACCLQANIATSSTLYRVQALSECAWAAPPCSRRYPA